MKLDEELEPLPIDSTFLVRPRSALGLKYVELTPGSARAGYPAGRGGAAQPGHAGAGRARRGAQHLRPADAPGRPGLAERLRRGARRPRPGPEPGDRGPEPAAEGPRARDAQPGRPRHAARPDLPGAGRRRRRGGPGCRAAGRAVREHGHHVRGAGKRGAALHPGDDQRVAAHAADVAPRSSRSSSPSCATRPPLRASCGRASAPCPRPRRCWRTRSSSAPRRCRRRRPSTAPWPTCSTRSRSSPRTRSCRAAYAACARPWPR